LFRLSDIAIDVSVTNAKQISKSLFPESTEQFLKQPETDGTGIERENKVFTQQ